MTQEHPITPPPELVRQWAEQMTTPNVGSTTLNFDGLVAQAARWGADQELEACCADLRMVLGPNQADWLRSVRRPKPPSLKEQALEALDLLKVDASTHGLGFDSSTIRRALEMLPNE